MKVVKNNNLTSFPKQITCPHCQSDLELESWRDIKGEQGTQYNEPYTNLWTACPCCHHKIVLDAADYTSFEIQLICQAHSQDMVQAYYDK